MATLHFLTLPLELRLQIYNYALQYNPATVTISSAQLEGSHSDLIHRLWGDRRRPFHGLPENCIPIIEPQYDSSLLSITRPAMVAAKSRPRPEESGICDYSPKPALLQVNKQINIELNRYIPAAQKRVSVFIAYPYGLHVLNSMATTLLQHADAVQIVGEYNNLSFNAAQAVKLSDDGIPGSATAKPNFPSQLSRLISDLLGRNPRVAQLQLRIYYPGPNSYSTVWGDDSSPTVIALRNIFAGEIQIEVWRGREGTGVCLSARPSLDGKRSVSTLWRRLSEGGPGEEKVGSWVIDSAWPDVSWTDSNDASTYQGGKEVMVV